MKALEEGKAIRCQAWEKGKFWRSPLHNNDSYRISVCMEEDWEVYDETPKLNFMQVIEGLKQGKRFKRQNWDYLYVSGSALDSLTFEDYQATDWIEVKE